MNIQDGKSELESMDAEVNNLATRVCQEPQQTGERKGR